MNLLEETNVRIIQASLNRTGSTILSNILQGLFYPKEPLMSSGFRKNRDSRSVLSMNFVIKTHNEHLQEVMKICGHTYNYWVISSNRGDKRYQCNHPNFISFEYEQLLESTSNPINTIVNTVAEKLKVELPQFVTDYMDINGSITRIKEMNAFYETIKTESFHFNDRFYRLHGHHKNRDDDLFFSLNGHHMDRIHKAWPHRPKRIISV